MKKTSVNFLIQLSVVTLALILILVGLLEVIKLGMPTFTVAIFAVLFVVTFLVYLLQVKIMTKNPDFSLHVILGSLILRLIIFAFFNFIMIYTDRVNAVPNVVLFFIVYLVFTTIEMITLFKQIGRSKSSS